MKVFFGQSEGVVLTKVERGEALVATGNQSEAYPTRREAVFVTILVVIAQLLSMIDNQVFPLLVTPIKAEFQLSDLEIGSLQGLAMTLMMGLCLLPAGYLADKTNRVRLYACAILLWSLSTALSGFCTNYAELFICRAAVGIAESVAYPTALSLIADLYDPPRRSKAIFVFYCATMIISGLSTTLCGLLISGVMHFSARVGHHIPIPPVWRMTFLLAAVPGLILAALFLRSKEPTRQHRSEERHGSDSIWRLLTMRPLLSASLLLAPVLSWIGTNAFIFWLPTILTRQFGFRLDAAGVAFGLATGMGTATGILLSAFITWWMRKRSILRSLLTPIQVGFLCSAVVTPAFLLAKDSWTVLLVYVLMLAANYTAVPAIANTIMSVTPGHFRGRIFATQQLISISFSMALLPAIGALSDKVFSGPTAPLFGCLALSIPSATLALVFLNGLTARVSRATESPDMVSGMVVPVQHK